MKLVISGVTSQVNDNLSDDDVIEVVRDEAPIEILSDGEETELENIKMNQITSVMQDFHFTSVPTILESHTEHNLDANDPLLNTSPKENKEEVNSNKDTAQTDSIGDNVPAVDQSNIGNNSSSVNTHSECSNTPKEDSVSNTEQIAEKSNIDKNASEDIDKVADPNVIIPDITST